MPFYETTHERGDMTTICRHCLLCSDTGALDRPCVEGQSHDAYKISARVIDQYGANSDQVRMRIAEIRAERFHPPRPAGLRTSAQWKMSIEPSPDNYVEISIKQGESLRGFWLAKDWDELASLMPEALGTWRTLFAETQEGNNAS